MKHQPQPDPPCEVCGSEMARFAVGPPAAKDGRVHHYCFAHWAWLPGVQGIFADTKWRLCEGDDEQEVG